jgi:hypothetical protein
MKRKRTSLVVTLAVAFAVAFSAVGVASTSHKPGHTLKIFGVVTATTQVDVDGDHTFSVGDQVIGVTKDYDKAGGTQIGRGTFLCTVVDATAGDFDCQGSDVLPGGEIRQAGRALGGDPTHFSWAVTGGTGKYMGVGGQIDGSFIDAQLTQANVTFTLING